MTGSVAVSRDGPDHRLPAGLLSRRPDEFQTKESAVPIQSERKRLKSGLWRTAPARLLLSLGVDQPSFARDRLTVVQGGKHTAQSPAPIGGGLNPNSVELPPGPGLRDNPAWLSP